MTVSISEVKAFNENPAEWYFKHVLKRIPRVEPVALRLGTLCHTSMERVLLGEPREQVVEDFVASVEAAAEDYRSMDRENSAKGILRYKTRLSQELTDWQFALPVEVVSTETPMSIELGNQTIVGRLDAVVRMGGYIGHMQHKFNSPQNWPGWVDHYLRSREVDPHECAYRLMLEAANPGIPYLGTLMNVVLKSGKDKSFQRLVMPKADEAFKTDLLWTIHRMIKCRTQGWAPWYRERALSPWGALSPYFPVLIGEASIDDDTLFKTAENRYADLEADE